MNRRDLDAWAAIHAPGAQNHDHSPIGFGELGTERSAQYIQAGFEQVPDFVLIPATLQARGNVALVSIPVRGETPAGVGFESDLVVVTVLDDNLRIVEDHFFAPEQWPEAPRCSSPWPRSRTDRRGNRRRNAVDDRIAGPPRPQATR